MISISRRIGIREVLPYESAACDISDVTSGKKLFSTDLPAMGVSAIDILVNNAGVMPCIFADPLTIYIRRARAADAGDQCRRHTLCDQICAATDSAIR